MTKSTSSPHIILIMTDQQRFDTIGAWGCDYMVTPNMDRLSRESISFRQAYCPGATCVASRAAIFTGMYPHNTGVYSFDPWTRHRNWVQDLSDHGYWCVNIGKMHFTPRDVPGGFRERVIVENPTNLTHAHGGADDDWGRYLRVHGLERPNHRQHTDPDWLHKFQGVPWHHEERFHSDVFIGDSAASWIREHKGDQPLFLQVGFTGPHEPWDPLPRHVDLYRDKEIPRRVYRKNELKDKPPQHLACQRFMANAPGEAQLDMRLATEERMVHMRRHYYAKITTVDEQLGQVLDALEKRGWLDNCLLIFCSDHGELLGDHDLVYKWLMYDPIVHVPLMIRHPGSVEHPSQVKDLVSLMDIAPTVLESAGIDIPTYFEGRSLTPYLQGDPIEPREFVICEDNYLVMMRTETHKLVYYVGQETDGELYDLRQDPHELWNLWHHTDHRETKTGLLHRLLAWLSTSTYYNAGYRRNRRREYRPCWPGTEEGNQLRSRNAPGKQLDYL